MNLSLYLPLFLSRSFYITLHHYLSASISFYIYISLYLSISLYLTLSLSLSISTSLYLTLHRYLSLSLYISISISFYISRIKAKAKNEKKVRVSRKTKQEIKAAATDAMIDKFAQKTVAQNPMTVLSTAIALFKQTIRLMG